MANGRQANSARFISGACPRRASRRCQAMKTTRHAAASASSSAACSGGPLRSATRPLSKLSVPTVPTVRPIQSSDSARLAAAPPGPVVGT